MPLMFSTRLKNYRHHEKIMNYVAEYLGYDVRKMYAGGAYFSSASSCPEEEYGHLTCHATKIPCTNLEPTDSVLCIRLTEHGVVMMQHLYRKCPWRDDGYYKDKVMETKFQNTENERG